MRLSAEYAVILDTDDRRWLLVVINCFVHETLLFLIEMRPVTLTLGSLQDKLAEIALIKCPMRFRGLIEWKAPPDMHLERRVPRSRRFDKAIKFLDRLRVGHSVVGFGIDSRRRLGRRFDTVG